ncbi:hypothetical protein PLICRDRAFT_576366 [Plicaturopsis crispa FD-325 SS-3]|nr:hypothetical protein PLICRDRAFT_576366 [Plicaturopsis crispa FD-325 SS-3]
MRKGCMLGVCASVNKRSVDGGSCQVGRQALSHPTLRIRARQIEAGYSPQNDMYAAPISQSILDALDTSKSQSRRTLASCCWLPLASTWERTRQSRCPSTSIALEDVACMQDLYEPSGSASLVVYIDALACVSLSQADPVLMDAELGCVLLRATTTRNKQT